MKVAALEKRPELSTGADLYARAWSQLQDRRGVGMAGPLPLMPVDIGAWLDIVGLHDPDVREDVYVVLVTMDRSWLKKRYDEIAKTTSDTEKRGPPKGPGKPRKRKGER